VTAHAVLWPIAAATAQLVVRGVGDAMEQGASFARVLLSHNEQADAAQDAPAVETATAELTNDSRMVQWKTAAANLKTQTAALHQLLLERFAAQGIDLSEPIILRTDSAGHLLVDQVHPDRAAIEQLFESDAGLASQVRQLFQQAASLQTPETGSRTFDASSIRLSLNAVQATFSAASPA